MMICPNCSGKDFEWFVEVTNTTPVFSGLLQLHDIVPIAALGCKDCNETIRTIDAQQIAKILNHEDIHV